MRNPPMPEDTHLGGVSILGTGDEVDEAREIPLGREVADSRFTMFCWAL